jgi:hypothetical protein
MHTHADGCAHAHAHTHTHTFPLIMPLLEAPVESFFWNLPEFGHCTRSDVLHGCKMCPLEAHFLSREQPEVKFKEYNGWVITGTFFSARNCRTTSDVWLGALSRCRNHCPCLPLVVPLPPNCIMQSLQNLYVQMTSNNLSKRYELMENQTIDVKEFQTLFDCSSYSDSVVNPLQIHLYTTTALC